MSKEIYIAHVGYIGYNVSNMAFDNPSLQHLTTAERVTVALRTAIVSGELEAGAPIRQETIAAEYDVSRMPVREALHQLEAEGLVVIYPARGAFVNRPTPDAIREIYDIRTLLECDALRRAFPNFTRGTLAQAEDLFDEMVVAKDAFEFGRIDEQFHTTLYRPSQRPRLLTLIQTMRNQVTQAFYVAVPLSSFKQSAQDDHRKILHACQSGNLQEAVDMLANHLNKSAAHTAKIWETP